jgi:nicotinamide mononucleotide transporter
MTYLQTVSHYLMANWLEVAGVATTLAGIWMTTRRWLSCWPVVLISDVIYFVVFYQSRLLSDAILQIVFIAFTLYGWWFWVRGVRDEGEVKVEPQPGKSMVQGLLLGAAGSIFWGYWMTRLHAALPYLDATLAIYSLVASWWGARKHISNWWLWIVIDLIYVGEYIYKGLVLTAVLYGLLIALAGLGVRDWQRAARQEPQTVSA